MAKTLTAYVHRKKIERQLVSARQTLNHLVELYDTGLWRRLYKEETFATLVRNARQAVDHWNEVLGKYDR
ncbi:MAG: hypothetical protein WA652_10265 [Xanthobacteraceae bacterium]|jgi:hypothetical protein